MELEARYHLFTDWTTNIVSRFESMSYDEYYRIYNRKCKHEFYKENSPWLIHLQDMSTQHDTCDDNTIQAPR